VGISVDIVHDGLAEQARPLVDQLIADKIASKLAAQDPTLWGADAQPEASIRLSWSTLHDSSRRVCRWSCWTPPTPARWPTRWPVT
jgi:hypothetical protein